VGRCSWITGSPKEPNLHMFADDTAVEPCEIITHAPVTMARSPLRA
jgi:hypothetical protein